MDDMYKCIHTETDRKRKHVLCSHLCCRRRRWRWQQHHCRVSATMANVLSKPQKVLCRERAQSQMKLPSQYSGWRRRTEEHYRCMPSFFVFQHLAMLQNIHSIPFDGMLLSLPDTSNSWMVSYFIHLIIARTASSTVLHSLLMHSRQSERAASIVWCLLLYCFFRNRISSLFFCFFVLVAAYRRSHAFPSIHRFRFANICIRATTTFSHEFDMLFTYMMNSLILLVQSLSLSLSLPSHRTHESLNNRYTLIANKRQRPPTETSLCAKHGKLLLCSNGSHRSASLLYLRPIFSYFFLALPRRKRGFLCVVCPLVFSIDRSILCTAFCGIDWSDIITRKKEV